MTPIATRYNAALIALLLLAVLVTALHSGLAPRFDDCRNPNGLYVVEGIAGSVLGQERWNLHDDLRLQMTSGTVPLSLEGVLPLRFQILRNRDAKRLYRSPLSFTPELEFASFEEVEWLPSRSGEVPIHVALGTTSEEIQLSLYLFVYDGAPVEDVFREEMSSALRHIVSGGPPLTLFIVSGTSSLGDFEAVKARAKQWLVSAWEFYDEVCSP